ncbi:MAG: PVC-type heme-binding CxxCH protein, partial [Rhodothermales bacterium]
MKPILFLAASLLLARPLAAQDNLTNVPDPDPAVQLAALHVAEGFEVNLFATDPMIDPPIQMAWDEQGRLWVATSTSYPQPVPGQAPNDKIFVLEDTDGDGQADRSTVFADGLLTPTGILVGDGGVYVANSTEILHLRDTDGDGHADARRVVLSGFGADDTHHLIHTFRWGPDGLFYLNQSVYIYSHIETPWGVRRLRGGGIWQFNPTTLQLEVLARGMWNAWGYEFDAWGQSFATDGAGFQGLHFIFPDVAYAPAFGVERVLEGLNPDHPKYAGIALISGRHFPEDWNGDLITNDYRANRVKRFVLTEDASGFRSDEQDDLIWTDHGAFRPVDVNVGPDGALYFADWYNPIIQHGEVDFRDPRRDHRHGRIWRVTAKDRPLVTPPTLHQASVEALLDALRLPEDWTRRQAKRLLRERGVDAVQPRLDAWVHTLDRNAPNATHDLLEALWTYQAIGVVEPLLLREVLAVDDHRARAAAVRVLYHEHARVADAEALLATAIADAHPRVRREALHALGQLESANAARLALSVLDHPMDIYLDYALWHTLRTLAPHWLPRFEADAGFLGDDPQKITFALKSVDAPFAIAQLTQRYQDGRVPDDATAEVLEVIAKHGSPDDLDAIFTLALDGAHRGENESLAHLKALETAAREYDQTPAGDP